jgi:hypothetical protein
MRLDRLLVTEQLIERTVETILVDLSVRELQQISKHRAPIPVLGYVQLAGRVAQPRRRAATSTRGDLRPRHLLLAQRQ